MNAVPLSPILIAPADISRIPSLLLFHVILAWGGVAGEVSVSRDWPPDWVGLSVAGRGKEQVGGLRWEWRFFGTGQGSLRGGRGVESLAKHRNASANHGSRPPWLPDIITLGLLVLSQQEAEPVRAGIQILTQRVQ